jgi:hypothetical protein
MVNRLGFHEYVRSSGEVCWRFSIPKTVFVIHVRSGMRADGSQTPVPDIGIRIYLMDITDVPLKPVVRVRRTQHSLRNTWREVNTLHKFVLTHKDRSGRKLNLPD